MKNGNANTIDLAEYDLSEIALLLEIATGSTYPHSILHRRLRLLNAEERKDVRGALNEALSLIADADDIISNRAEAENDPWEV